MAVYTWLPLSTAIQNIQDRLNDAGVFWPVAEVRIYLVEALRILNALTEYWRAEFPFNTQGSQWNNLGTMSNSPRLRTVTDAQLATEMEYMLLEPAVGIGSWTGTNQFSVEKIQSALSVRRNEVIQAAGCNTVDLPAINAVPNQRRVNLADTTLEVRRMRFLQLMANTTGTCASGASTVSVASTTGISAGLVIKGTGIANGAIVTSVGNNTIVISLPTTAVLSSTAIQFYQPYYMKRSDTQAFHYFNSDYLQESGTPTQWSVASEPPLAFDPDVAPAVEGQYDVMVLQSGPAFGNSPSLLGIPDDWSWVPMYGALADLLSEEPESTDRQRAAYCAKRYEDGLQMMSKSNWFNQALVNGVVADTPSLDRKDRWSIGWQEDTGSIPCVVTDGIDQFNIGPCTPVSVLLTVIQNAPFLDATGQFVQVSRDDWDQCLNYVQHVASFKLGGSDFSDTIPLLDEFLNYCVRKNRRQATYGLYVDVLNGAGQKQDAEVPR